MKIGFKLGMPIISSPASHCERMLQKRIIATLEVKLYFLL